MMVFAQKSSLYLSGNSNPDLRGLDRVYHQFCPVVWCLSAEGQCDSEVLGRTYSQGICELKCGRQHCDGNTRQKPQKQIIYFLAGRYHLSQRLEKDRRRSATTSSMVGSKMRRPTRRRARCIYTVRYPGGTRPAGRQASAINGRTREPRATGGWPGVYC